MNNPNIDDPSCIKSLAHDRNSLFKLAAVAFVISSRIGG